MADRKKLIEASKEYVSAHIGGFHSARLNSLANLKLEKILKRKNPYLFRAKNILTAEAFVRTILDAHLSSQEETMFGEFLEGLAIFINTKVYKGNKSAAEGIDLEFIKEGVKYIVAIKSGPNWGNASQIKKMRDCFRLARKVLNTSSSQKTPLHIVAINGCCYGRDNKADKGDYLKYCGQRFWEFVSGDTEFYIEIVEPLGYKAKEKNEEFDQAYSELINRFTDQFIKDYCPKGKINWNKLVELNSKQ